MSLDESQVHEDRADKLFEALLSKSEIERKQVLAKEGRLVAQRVEELIRADRANANSNWLETPASLAAALFNTTPDASELDNQDLFTLCQSSVAPRYDLSQELGRGGFGVVYSAIDNELGREVAIKFVVSHIDECDLVLEAKTVAGLDHPNIVPVYDVGRMRNGLYIVSKLIPGRSLNKIVSGKAIPARSAAKIVAQIAAAAYCAHQQAIVHRDIKPSNILLDKNTAYLCDFGLALKEENLRFAPSFAGTVLYMSPEQAKGESEFVDGRSDIYSLGVVLYELISGRRPFKGNVTSVLEQIVNREVTPPRQFRKEIPAKLELICLKALAIDPLKRFATARDFAEALKGWLHQDKTGRNETPQKPTDFEALFHPVGAFSAIVNEMLKRPSLLIVLLPSLLHLSRGGSIRPTMRSDSSLLLFYLPTLLMLITPVIGAAIKCRTRSRVGLFKSGKMSDVS